MIRLFSALFPSAEAREHLVRAVRPLKDNGLRWVDPDNWHITLDFCVVNPLSQPSRAELDVLIEHITAAETRR